MFLWGFMYVIKKRKQNVQQIFLEFIKMLVSHSFLNPSVVQRSMNTVDKNYFKVSPFFLCL